MASSETLLPVLSGDADRQLPWWGHVLLGLPAVLGGIGYGLQGKPLPSEMLAPLQEIVKQQRRRQKIAALEEEEDFLRQYVPAPTGGRRPGSRLAPPPGPTAPPAPVMPGAPKTADEFIRKFGD